MDIRSVVCYNCDFNAKDTIEGVVRIVKNFTLESAGRQSHYDHLLIMIVLLLTGAGIVALYSASYSFAELFYSGDKWHFVSRQLILAAFGFVFLVIIARLKIETLRAMIMPIVLAAIVLCLLTFVPGIGIKLNGAARWIRIGDWTFQPSELVKLILPVYLAHIFDKKQDKLDSFAVGVLPPTLITALFFTLIYQQNNFSTALFVAVNALFIFFLAGVRMKYFISATVILIPISFLLVLTKEHRLKRLISYIFPDWEPQGAGYQVHSSIITIASGGFWGKGLGQGVRKVRSVPEIQSDFIFASYAEESGFIGVILFILLFAAFAWRAYAIALRQNTIFKKLLVFGLVNTIVSQALLNIAVVSGAVPATGVPLPFFSAGGSSLAVTLIACGFLINVSKDSLGADIANER
ncbi:MAG: putative lipid II flippase FtsW [Termitinemataceae bacterium]|nr:MAG: putative lipid II flippase FtsW [Termitinemataceae bacterium]